MERVAMVSRTLSIWMPQGGRWMREQTTRKKNKAMRWRWMSLWKHHSLPMFGSLRADQSMKSSKLRWTSQYALSDIRTSCAARKASRRASMEEPSWGNDDAPYRRTTKCCWKVYITSECFYLEGRAEDARKVGEKKSSPTKAVARSTGEGHNMATRNLSKKLDEIMRET